jgi:hypothetical protein
VQLQASLAEEKHRHQEEMAALEKKLKENFVMVGFLFQF